MLFVIDHQKNLSLDRNLSLLLGYWLLVIEHEINLSPDRPSALCPPAANAVHLAGSPLRFDMLLAF